MRLKHIKLSGFKSFVDPTSLSFPANLVGVVGPNGCGKSNVIDAVRWVMGESSAKTLRGDSMADVIFNGSSARKPVGKAAVELVFDNSAGKAPGAYAGYGEIAIRRELARDGQSSYFINKTRCRRRDITDIFLGTGLGPRSYSIIEQGMVSRIIEARPEELRTMVEEAAGISKYKERRRETETRIRHTKENLERVEDIRQELETQLRRLKRQSSAAARYKTLKQEERTLRSQLLSLRWRGLDQQVDAHDLELSKIQTQLQAQIAEQRELETDIERLRQCLQEANDQLNRVQGDYYQVGADIANKEQSIEHAKQTRRQRGEELKRLSTEYREAQDHLVADRGRLGELQTQLASCRERTLVVKRELGSAVEALESADSVYQGWQAEWDEFGRDAARPEQEREVQRTRIDEHYRQIEQVANRQVRLAESLAAIEAALAENDTVALRTEVEQLDTLFESLEEEILGLEGRIQQQRELVERTEDELHDAQHRYQVKAARLRSLEEIQAAALGAEDEDAVRWLEQTGLVDCLRLAGEIEVEPGWEKAVDCVLGGRLGAVRVDSLDGVAADIASFRGAGLTLLENSEETRADDSRQTLLHKVASGTADLQSWLAHVATAEDIGEAILRRDGLASHESIVTRDGVWVGRNWLVLARGEGANAGVLVRDREIEQLTQETQGVEKEIKELNQLLDDYQQRLTDWEQQQAQARQSLSGKAAQRTQLHKKLGHAEAREAELRTRRTQIRADLGELDEALERAESELVEARSRLETAQRLSEDFRHRHSHLSSERTRLRTALDQAREQADAAREARHVQEFEEKRLQAEIESLHNSIARMESRQSSMSQREHELRNLLNDDQAPEAMFEEELKSLLTRRLEVETLLAEARKRVEGLTAAIREQDQNRTEHENAAQQIRESLEQSRLGRQELLVRRDTLIDQIKEAGAEPTAVLAELPEEADAQGWEEQLQRVTARIDRIGPVNLVAIEEYEEQSERKSYLDKQHLDLSEALAMLEEVIQKIDRETRSRFRQTYEKLDKRFQEFFPQLFGGGSAYLELTGSDLLNTGVAVMARPPGKRNSTIHLLSGGEKALTAVALLFAFFDLNPAPFCMLDEVDAPLDDANVERYCGTLRNLCERTQLIVITHNKITMEAASILVGVTMAEPGVSRLVSVDVDEAMEFAAQ